jgi:5'-3' exonuclease
VLYDIIRYYTTLLDSSYTLVTTNMGVRFLNTLIKRRAPCALKYVSLSQYSGKTIVIDTSIYIHKYLASNSLMESMYFMISQFKYLNITPVFIFDGVAPAEKKGVLNARASVRENALEQYNRLDTLLHKSDETGDPSTSTVSASATYSAECECPEQIRRRMQSLKRRFIRISNFELNELKRLMREFGVEYIESDGESDLLCAYLVKCGFAQACMSDDMDLFLYGCPVVLRHVNIWHSAGVEYTLDTILRDMAVSLHGFQMVCILSGTDYTSNGGDIESNQPARQLKFRIYLSDLLKSYQEYQEDRVLDDDAEQSQSQFDSAFYDWVVERHKKQVPMNACDLQLARATFEKAYSIFSCDPSSEMKQYVQNMHDTAIRIETNDTVPVSEYEVPHKVKRIMAKYNFIYI